MHRKEILWQDTMSDRYVECSGHSLSERQLEDMSKAMDKINFERRLRMKLCSLLPDNQLVPFWRRFTDPLNQTVELARYLCEVMPRDYSAMNIPHPTAQALAA